MFNLFRSQQKTVKVFLSVILGLVAISMVITLIPGLFSTPAAGDLGEPVLAEVDGRKITIQDVQFALRDYVRGGQVPADSLAFMARNIIDNEITDQVLLLEAEKLGIAPTERDLAVWIRDQMPFLFESGSFDREQYTALIRQRFQVGVPEFERSLMRQLTIEMRLRQFVTDNIVMTEDEVREAFRERNEKAKIDYVLVSGENFRSQVSPSGEDLENFFSSNKFRYRIPEKRSATIVTIDDEAIPAPEFSETELRNFYNQNRYRFETPERVLAKHILFMTMDMPEEEKQAVENKAREVLAQVEGGGDFEALAEEHSEDPGTSEKGGDLGWVVRGQTVPNFEETAFRLRPGETSGLVETEYGYHIIRVEKKESARLKAFEDAREEIVRDLAAEREQTARFERVDEVTNALRDAAPGEAADVARSMGLPVETYAGMDRSNAPQELMSMPPFFGAIFSAAEGDVLTHQEGDRTLIAVVSGITAPREAEFAEVRERVERDYIAAEARKLAEARAREVLAAAKEAGGLRAAAGRFGLSVKSSGFFTRRDNVEGFTTAASIGDPAFVSEPGSIHGPVSVGDQFGVYEVTDHEAPDMTLFAEQRQEIREEFMDGRREEAYNLYKGLVRQRYETSGKIRRYDQRIDQFIRGIARG